jgi:hypothetical protein
MHLLKAAALAASAAAALAASEAAAQQADQPSAVYELKCDRACLIGVLTQYMDALRARTPSAAPLADTYRFTENNIVLPHGKGLWGTVDKVDAIGMEVADTQTQNAAWFGSAVENGQPVLYAVRVHVKKGRIDEVESVVHRKTTLPAPFGDVTNMKHDPDFNAVLPPEQRRPRERLKAIADAYFDTVELNDGQVFAPFHDDCGRMENGMVTTAGNKDPNKKSEFVDGCEAQFKLGSFKINKRLRERRFPIIDEERGIVVGTTFFDHANEWDEFKLTDGTVMKTWLKWPNSITLLEAFRIKDAKISRVEVVFTYVPYGMHNPWFGEASRPPAPVSSPAACNAACLSSLAGRVMSGYANRGQWKNLPWAETVGYEENSVGMQVNEGTWGSTTAIDKSPLVIADDTLGRALWIGRIEEHGAPAWAAVTVSADGDRIGRVEAVIHRKDYAGPYADAPSAPSFSTLAAGRRTPRAAMLAAVDRFNVALTANDGAAPADFAADCQWTVNGQTVAVCAAPFAGRQLQAMKEVRDRKVIAVDEARGLVAVSAYEDFPATTQTFTDAAGKTYKDSLPYPRTAQVVVLFRFDGGKIAAVQAITAELGYGMKPR